MDRRTQNATQIVVGAMHAFAVDPDESLWAWATTVAGQLGRGLVGLAVRTPQKVPGWPASPQLAVGYVENMALRSDGTLPVWGAEDVGLRGDGIDRGNSSLPVPTPVTPVSGMTRIALASGTVLVLAPPVIMPHVVGEQRASALADLHALGLCVHELFVPDPDPRCDHVRLVESQNPPPGTVVGPARTPDNGT